MLQQYISHIASDGLLTACTATMLCLFMVDLSGLLSRRFTSANIRHIDFKSPIVSIGIFGTFLGILSGLYEFDPSRIAESVPSLLAGLKFAFITSVFGMFLSVTLSITQKVLSEASEEPDVLKNIDAKMSTMIQEIKTVSAVLDSPTQLINEFSEMRGFLERHLEKINESLEKALDKLSAGATKEVIAALEKVIFEFNTNLQDQFGENFKELNAACLKLLEWQRNYREHVDTAEEHLKEMRVSMQEATKATTSLVENTATTQEVCEKVAELLATYDVQVRTLSTHLESCKTLGEEAGEFLTKTEKALTQSSDNLTTFSGTIENSVSKQSEALAELTEGINQQLPKALGELEDVLTNVTNQFARDYQSLFEFVTAKRNE